MLALSKSTLADKEGAPFALIGLARSGKDYVVEKCGRRSISLASPMEELMKNLLHPRGIAMHDKKTPGYRRVLQLWGQWGRGLISEEYPLTPDRLAWLGHLRAHGEDWMGQHRLNPNRFGCPSFWIDGAVKRSGLGDAISNLRWPSDVEGVPEDWRVLLVIREQSSHKEAMEACGESEAVWYDQSESMALWLTRELMTPGSRHGSPYPKDAPVDVLNRLDGVIWNGPPAHPMAETIWHNLRRQRPSAKMFFVD